MNKTQRRKSIRARVALSFHKVYKRRPTDRELDRYSKLAEVLYTTIAGVAPERAWLKKKKQYKKETKFELTKKLADYPNFTKDTIDKRQAELAKLALKVWNPNTIV
ncbi:DUF1524 domain-containing protein [Patescibacteria group bacterium]|nr:DUF1524 domain-containing protein [Patescibacteria group bacterium]